MLLGNGNVQCDERQQMSGEEYDVKSCQNKPRLLDHIFKGQSASKRPSTKTPRLPALQKWFSPPRLCHWVPRSPVPLLSCFPYTVL